VAAVAGGNSLFGSRLYEQLRDEEGNIIMSPFSVSGVMAMVGAGAGGNTLTQVQHGMSFPPAAQLALGYRDAIPALRTNDNFTMEAANSVFGQVGPGNILIHLPRPASRSCPVSNRPCTSISTPRTRRRTLPRTKRPQS
jgi:hypothetical protein